MITIKSLVSALSLSMIALSTAHADPTTGEWNGTGSLRPGVTQHKRILLNSGEETIFVVRGDGDGDIDCVVQDRDGDIVGRDTDTTDICIIHLVPNARFYGESDVFDLICRNNGRITSNFSVRIY